MNWIPRASRKAALPPAPSSPFAAPPVPPVTPCGEAIPLGEAMTRFCNELVVLDQLIGFRVWEGFWALVSSLGCLLGVAMGLMIAGWSQWD